VITFIGVLDSGNLMVPTSGSLDGLPIYERSSTYGFWLVIEGRPGGTGAAIEPRTFNWSATDPTVLPGLLIEVSRPLGNASKEVCDDTPASAAGGVPAIDPADFSPVQPVADAINDLACRFKDQDGNRFGRGSDWACIVFDDGLSGFANRTSTIQFCGQVKAGFSFPTGYTRVTIRIRDTAGNVSAATGLVIRVVPF
jgi:hypothetical protein